VQVASNESFAPETVLHAPEIVGLNYSLPVAAFVKADQAIYVRIAAVNDMGPGLFSATNMLVPRVKAILLPSLRLFAASPNHAIVLPHDDSLSEVLTSQLLTAEVRFTTQIFVSVSP
jgi:hypothetical protein